MDSISVVVKKYYWQTGAKKLGEVISDVCWNLREGFTQHFLMSKARTYIRDVVYTPQAVLKALDLAGGV